MKFNNKLKLVEYLQVVNEIANEFFDENTYEYTPQIGEMFAVCAYFNHCVELEETDDIVIHPIEDIMDMQQLYDNVEFMKHYNEAILDYDGHISLLFGCAYDQAKDIVEYKKSDANAFATAISSGMGAILKSFRDTFSDEDMAKFTDIAKQITEGKLSSEAIVEAYGNSDRFKEKTEELNAHHEPSVIPFPQKK